MTSRQRQAAAATPLERVHGRSGASYLEHLKASTQNRLLSSAIQELEHEAESKDHSQKRSAKK